MSYFSSECTYMTCSDYCSINNCTSTTANRDLNVLKNEGIILGNKIGQTFMYTLNPDYIGIKKERSMISNDTNYSATDISNDRAVLNSVIDESGDFDSNTVNEPVKQINVENVGVSEEINIVTSTSSSQEDISTQSVSQMQKSMSTAKNFGDLPESTKSSSMYNFKQLKNVLKSSRRVNVDSSLQDDEPVKMFYDLIGGSFDKEFTDINSPDKEIHSDDDKTLLSASEYVMQKLAYDMGIDDIYDDKVIQRLNPKVFPIYLIDREKRKRDKKSLSE